MAELTLSEIMLAMFDGKATAEETAVAMHEAFYGMRHADNRCVCCGEIIPEGRMVCPNCERGSKRG